MVTIPVMTHRLFGMRIRRRDARRPGRPPRSPYVPDPFDPGSIPGVPLGTGEIDRSHGTQRIPQEIAAFFAPDPALGYTRGLSANDVWGPAGVAFRLVDSAEHAIDSDLADMMSTSPDSHGPVADRFCRADAVNLFLVRALTGAWGVSSGTYAPGDGRRAYAFLGDLRSLEPTTDRWAREIVVLAHEFGHLLGLPHMPDPANLMHSSAGPGATTLTRTQLRIAQSRAVHFPTV